MSTTLPPAILIEERENCGIGVLEKERDVFAIVLGSRLVTGERSSSGEVALGRDEKRKRKEVGGLIWSGFSVEFRGGAGAEGRVVFIGR